MIRATVAAFALLTCAYAHAQDSGFFLSGSIGHTKASTSVPSGYSASDSDTSWTLGGGYRLNRNFGIEGGYRDFGRRAVQGGGSFNNVMLHITRSGANIPLNFGTVTSSHRSTADITACTLGGVVAYPVTESIELTARAGWYRWRSKWQATGGTTWTDGVTASGETINASGTNTGTEPYFGAGFSYSLSGNSAISLNWTRFKSASGITDDADALDVGLTYRF